MRTRIHFKRASLSSSRLTLFKVSKATLKRHAGRVYGLTKASERGSDAL
jgi:hypothetical protein